MSVTLGLTETAAIGALRAVLLTLLPPGVEILRAEINRVAEPAGPDFCMLTPISRTRLTMTVSSWVDGSFATPPGPGIRQDCQETQITVQLDIHGPNSADNTQIITTLFRSEVVTAGFDALGLGVQTLYAEDARQTPFINDSAQIEYRWTVDLVLQVNPVVTSPQQFAAALSAGLISADAAYKL